MNWFKKLISEDFSDDVKRAVFLALVGVHIIATFLLMYIKIEIANKDLVQQCLDWNSWLIIATGSLVVTAPVFEKWRPGAPTTVVNQDVQEQTVISEPNETTTTTTTKKQKR